MKIITFIISLLLSSTILMAGVELPANNISELVKYEGDYVVVTGRVAQTYIPESGKVLYLNFARNYKEAITAVIFPNSFGRFEQVNIDPRNYYTGKRVKVEGKIKLYKGRPQIIVNSPEQINIY